MIQIIFCYLLKKKPSGSIDDHIIFCVNEDSVTIFILTLATDIDGPTSKCYYDTTNHRRSTACPLMAKRGLLVSKQILSSNSLTLKFIFFHHHHNLTISPNYWKPLQLRPTTNQALPSDDSQCYQESNPFAETVF